MYMPIESYMLKLQAQGTTWFSVISGAYSLSFEFIQGMCLAGFICSSTPATATMIDIAQTGLLWCSYLEYEIKEGIGLLPALFPPFRCFLDAAKASFTMFLNIAPKLPYQAWPPASQWIGKCEDFWKLRDIGVY